MQLHADDGTSAAPSPLSLTECLPEIDHVCAFGQIAMNYIWMPSKSYQAITRGASQFFKFRVETGTRDSIAHHLHLNDDDKKKRVLFIHRHHFSLLGWRNSRQKATHISANTAKQWDKEIGRRSYHDNVNSLEYIINKQLKRKVMDQEKGFMSNHQ
jgi:hypothetical protein